MDAIALIGLLIYACGAFAYGMALTFWVREERLEPRQFFRISRAAIVNLDAVKEVAPTSGGHGEVTLRDGVRLEVSRRRFRQLTERLGGAD